VSRADHKSGAAKAPDEGRLPALPHLCNNNLPAWMYEPQSGLTRAARCPS
jgi:hypothetical protein